MMKFAIASNNESNVRGKMPTKLSLKASVLAAGLLVGANGFMFTEAGTEFLPQAEASITGFADAPPASTIDINRDVTMTFIVPDPRNFEPSASDGRPRGGNEGYTITLTRLDTPPVNTTEGYKAAAELELKSITNTLKLDSRSGVTDKYGAARFDGLKPGAYLIEASNPRDPSAYYPQPQKMIVVLPTVGENRTWNYNPTIIAKFIPEDCDCPSITPTPPPVTTKPNPPTSKTPEKPTTPTTPSTSTKPKRPQDTEPGRPPRTTSPGSTERQDKGRAEKPLPITGVQAAGIVGVAAALIGGGFVLLSFTRSRKRD